MIHIYTASLQPATGFVDRCSEIEHRHGFKPNRLLWCSCCHKQRPAKNVRVQCFYDGWNFWCAPDKGCKHPALITAKKRSEFRNRSAGQRRRWASGPMQKQPTKTPPSGTAE